MKPLCGCGGRATTEFRGNPICRECLLLMQDHEDARRGVYELRALAEEHRFDPWRRDADALEAENWREQTGNSR
jgi:hypothetical protein